MGLASSFAKSPWSDSTNKLIETPVKVWSNGWSASVYLDLDVLLAELKADDWLASEVDIESVDEPKTSVATGIELQYVMEDEWDHGRVVLAHHEIIDQNVELVALTADVLDAAAELRSQDETLNAFDGVHLGSATVLDEPIVSTDTLFSGIPEIEHIDPRELG